MHDTQTQATTLPSARVELMAISGGWPWTCSIVSGRHLEMTMSKMSNLRKTRGEKRGEDLRKWKDVEMWLQDGVQLYLRLKSPKVYNYLWTFPTICWDVPLPRERLSESNEAWNSVESSQLKWPIQLLGTVFMHEHDINDIARQFSRRPHCVVVVTFLSRCHVLYTKRGGKFVRSA
jgi:hypothetical protein